MDRPKVVVSYPFAESDWAREFADSLVKRGADVWLDQFEVRAGEPIREAVEKGLRQSNLVVALISSSSIRSPSFFFELGAAIGMGKRVVAIVPNDVDPSQLPLSLRNRRFIRKGTPEITAEELVGAEIAPEP